MIRKALTLLAILTLVLVLPLTAAADGPADPYAVPQSNPQPVVVHAQSLPPGSVVFTNGTNTGPPVCVKAVVVTVNPDTPVFLCATVVRPEGGGSLHLLKLYTADGVQSTFDLQAYSGFEDCFGGAPFVSAFTHTVKVEVNCKRNDTGNGNDRVSFPVDTGLEAYDPWEAR